MSKPFISKYKQKQANLNKKLNESLKQKQYNDQIKEELQTTKEKDSILGRNNKIQATNKKAIDNARIKSERELLALNTQNIMSTLFAALIYNTYPNKIADKSKLRSHIANKSQLFFNEALNAELVDYKFSDIFKNARFQAATYAKNAHGVLDQKRAAEGAKVVYQKGRTEIDYLVNVVNKKIQSAVIKESELVDIRQSLNENLLGKKYGYRGKTLFRTLHEINITETLNNEEFLKEDVTESDINMTALAEAVLDYTIMELIHTSKLCTFDMKEVRKGIQSGSLKVNTKQNSAVKPKDGSVLPKGDGLKPRTRENENRPDTSKPTPTK